MEEASNKKSLQDSIDQFTKILEIEDQSNFDALLGRAKAYNKLENYQQAAEDAKHATTINPNSATAFYELGRALHSLDQFQSAKEAFETASSLEPSKKIYKHWVGMCLAGLGEKNPMPQQQQLHPGISSLMNSTQVPPQQQKPTTTTIDDPEYAKYWSSAPKTTIANNNNKEHPEQPSNNTINTTHTTTTTNNKYRYQWFQSPQKVEVNVMAKGLSKDQVTVTIQPNHLYVSISNNNTDSSSNTNGGVIEYELDIPLYSTINVDASRYAVLGTKIEIQLVKVDQGKEWKTLDASGQNVITATTTTTNSMMSGASNTNTTNTNTNTTKTAAPSPYAGKAGQINWDALVDNDDDDDTTHTQDDITEFFKKLYADADEDMKRAMMKSYQESNGTALSTVWDEVKNKDFSSTNQ